MFSMGRFDPRQIDDDVKQQSSTRSKESPVSKKRQRSNHPVKDDNDGTQDEVVNMKSSRFKPLENKIHNDNEDRIPSDDDSSSVQSSSSDSSSSVPSSDESDIEGNSGNEKTSTTSTTTTTLKVIAPEQIGCDAGIVEPNKRSNITNERIDDLDDGMSPPTDVHNIRFSQEIEMALKVSKLPIQDAAKIWNLQPFLIQNLQENGFQSFFPIQALVIPDVIASERHVHIRNRDICVSAPTGSGKTLAFVLPVLNSLAGRRVKRLRALIVLPSRDLGELLYIIILRSG
jgi:hypothetical protein